MGSVLGRFLLGVVVHIASQAVYYAPPPVKPAYAVAGVEAKTETPAAAAAPATEAAPDFGTVLPMADAMAGAPIAGPRPGRHDWAKGRPHQNRPNPVGG